MLLLVLTSWLKCREREAIAYLIEENRLLRRQLGRRRLRLTDADRRRLAARAYRVGRRWLREIATIVAPDTLLRWHRQLVARKWTSATSRASRRGGEFLAHHMIHAHSSLAKRAPAARGGLSPKRLRQVLEYIDEHLAQSITMRELATLAGVSVRHFERAFRQATGVPPHAFVLNKRVAAARHLLSTSPSLTVDTVAERVGFSSASHLSTAFRRQLGCSPSTFRKAAR